MSSHDPGCKRPINLPSGITPHYVFGGANDELRYLLEYRFASRGGNRAVLAAMMNPSMAGRQGGDGTHYTDMTVLKMSRLALKWGYDRLLVVNALPYSLTHSKDLLKIQDPTGTDNDKWILYAADQAKDGLIVVAHGRLPGEYQPYANRMVNLLAQGDRKLHVLKLLPDGTPAHPLGRGKGWIPESVQPQRWEPKRC